MTIYRSDLPALKYDELAGLYSAHTIADYGTARGSVLYKGLELICTGGPVKGVIECYRIVPREKYTGDPEPMRYIDHWQDVDRGNRERSYAGMLIRCKRRDMVIIPPLYEYKRTNEGQQTDLFQ